MAAQVIRLAGEKAARIATAESCTGGLVAAALTEIAGASEAFDRGFVTYSNPAKNEMLGVPPELIARHGAVSAEVAAAMAAGALARSAATLAVAVTGIAGPGGGSAEKPVGLVFFCGVSRAGKRLERREVFAAKGREAVRAAATATALAILRDLLGG
ncbi:MAG: nicotinamide-nucleotide amidohydrolase family protein [Bauldia sp.]